MKRLYVAGSGDSFSYCMATSMQQASEMLGSAARVPDPDDIRLFWTRSNIGTMSAKEVFEKFGVTRQAVDQWRAKGGRDLPRRLEFVAQKKRQLVQAALEQHPKEKATRISRQVGVSRNIVLRVANELNVTLNTKRSRMPSDEELVQLATGRTWREFATAAGYKLATLRTYVYRNKALAEAIRAVRKRLPVGHHARGRMDAQKVREMGDQGMTAYAIAEVLGVEQMTVRAYLKRWRKEQENAGGA